MIGTSEKKPNPLCSPYPADIELLRSWAHNSNNIQNKSCGNLHIMDEHLVCFRVSSREYFHGLKYIDNPSIDSLGMLPTFSNIT